MPFIQYSDIKLSSKRLETISYINEIIEEYTTQGYDLTVRQLYYQFVSRCFTPKWGAMLTKQEEGRAELGQLRSELLD